jgi:hypothetical protein
MRLAHDVGICVLLCLTNVNWAIRPAGADSTVSNQPERRAIIIGGNCEDPDKSENSFLAPMIYETSSLKTAGWRVYPLYGGSRERCTTAGQSSRCQAPDNINSWTRPADCCGSKGTPRDEHWVGDNLAKAAEMEPDKLPKSGKEEFFSALDQATTMPEGSELLISIQTHGAPRLGKKAHWVCLADEGALSVDDPYFLARLSKLKNSGIRVAITDGSCFSGDSAEVLGKYGCVITAQTSNRVAAGSLISDVLGEITGGMGYIPNASLDDVYSGVLNENLSLGVLEEPQISGFHPLYSLNENSARFITDHSYLLDYPDAITWDKQVDLDRGLACRTPEQNLTELQALLRSVPMVLRETAFSMLGQEFITTSIIQDAIETSRKLKKLDDDFAVLQTREKGLVETLSAPTPFHIDLSDALRPERAIIERAIADTINESLKARGDTGAPFKQGSITMQQIAALGGGSISLRASFYKLYCQKVLYFMVLNGFRSKSSTDMVLDDLANSVFRAVNASVSAMNLRDSKPYLETVSKVNDFQNKTKSERDVLSGQLHKDLSLLNLQTYIQFKKLHSRLPEALQQCVDFKVTPKSPENPKSLYPAYTPSGYRSEDPATLPVVEYAPTPTPINK